MIRATWRQVPFSQRLNLETGPAGDRGLSRDDPSRVLMRAWLADGPIAVTFVPGRPMTTERLNPGWQMIRAFRPNGQHPAIGWNTRAPASERLSTDDLWLMAMGELALWSARVRRPVVLYHREQSGPILRDEEAFEDAMQALHLSWRTDRIGAVGYRYSTTAPLPRGVRPLGDLLQDEWQAAELALA